MVYFINLIECHCVGLFRVRHLEHLGVVKLAFVLYPFLLPNRPIATTIEGRDFRQNTLFSGWDLYRFLIHDFVVVHGFVHFVYFILSQVLFLHRLV